MFVLNHIPLHHHLNAADRPFRSEARDGAASLTVVIGTGHHAVRGERVPPAVRAYLDEQGYRYSDVSPDRMGGMLRVLL